MYQDIVLDAADEALRRECEALARQTLSDQGAVHLALESAHVPILPSRGGKSPALRYFAVIRVRDTNRKLRGLSRTVLEERGEDVHEALEALKRSLLDRVA